MTVNLLMVLSDETLELSMLINPNPSFQSLSQMKKLHFVSCEVLRKLHLVWASIVYILLIKERMLLLSSCCRSKVFITCQNWNRKPARIHHKKYRKTWNWAEESKEALHQCSRKTNSASQQWSNSNCCWLW